MLVTVSAIIATSPQTLPPLFERKHRVCEQTLQKLLDIRHSLVLIPNRSKSPRFLKKAWQRLLNIRHSLMFVPNWSKSPIIYGDLPHLNKSQQKLPQFRLPQTLPFSPLSSLNLPLNFHNAKKEADFRLLPFRLFSFNLPRLSQLNTVREQSSVCIKAQSN